MATFLVDANEIKFKHPFSMILAGNRRTGKTHFTKTLLLSIERYITPQIEHIIWFYASPQTIVFDELTQSLANIEFVQGLPSTDISDTYLAERNGSKLVIIDDLMTEANARQDVNHLFTRGRHEDTSIVFLIQNFHNQGKYMRENSLNADYVVQFKNPRDTSIITHLGRQMGNTKFLQKAFALATREPFSHLFLDLRSDTSDELRYRSNVLGDYPIVYTPL